MTHYINGEWIEGRGEAFASANPATGETLWEGKAASTEQVQAAVRAASEAFARWSIIPLAERVKYLEAFAALVDQRKDELAELIAKEMGKVLWDAKTEAAATVGKLKFSLKAYEERTGERHHESSGVTASLYHRPHGVMAVYGPYNFPAHLPNGHIVPALLAGNTVVFKPSELTPAVAEWMVKCWEAAGLPTGVLNLVQGEKESGIALSHAPVHGILFTGSAATGKILHKQLAGRPEILLALELGGNNPLVVAEVADVAGAAYETIQSAYLTSGQRCTCARRLIVVDSPIADAYLDTLTQMASSLKVGAYTESPEPFYGPVVGNAQADGLLLAQDTLLTKGAKPLLEMQRLHADLPFLSPALLDVTGVEDVPDEEYFGPMLQLYRVKDMQEAIAVANNTQFGLSAGLLADDAALYEQFRQRVRAGIINWNRQTTGASGMAPFGGIGCSGNHHAAGYYAADYCAYPVASMEQPTTQAPEKPAPGVSL